MGWQDSPKVNHASCKGRKGTTCDLCVKGKISYGHVSVHGDLMMWGMGVRNMMWGMGVRNMMWGMGVRYVMWGMGVRNTQPLAQGNDVWNRISCRGREAVRNAKGGKRHLKQECVKSATLRACKERRAILLGEGAVGSFSGMYM